MLLWRSFGYLATVVPQALPRRIANRLAAVRAALAVLVIATTIAVLPILVARTGDGCADVADPAIVVAVLFETSVNSGWWGEGCAAVLLAATLVLLRHLKRL